MNHIYLPLFLEFFSVSMCYFSRKKKESSLRKEKKMKRARYKIFVGNVLHVVTWITGLCFLFNYLFDDRERDGQVERKRGAHTC